MFPLALLCWIARDFSTRLPSFFPFSYHLCAPGFVNISPLNLSVDFDRGIFWADSKRGKCKALHPLLNNITTWEASVRYLHFMASVSPFGKQSHPKLVDAEGANWQVLAAYCHANGVFAFSITSLKNKTGKIFCFKQAHSWTYPTALPGVRRHLHQRFRRVMKNAIWYKFYLSLFLLHAAERCKSL